MQTDKETNDTKSFSYFIRILSVRMRFSIKKLYKYLCLGCPNTENRKKLLLNCEIHITKRNSYGRTLCRCEGNKGNMGNKGNRGNKGNIGLAFLL